MVRWSPTVVTALAAALLVAVSVPAAAVFTEEAAARLVSDTGPSQAVAWGDFDSDLDEDLALCVDNTVARLFENNGSGNFTEVTTPFPGMTDNNSAVWFDWDKDGDLDIFFGAVFNDSFFFENNAGTFTDSSTLFSSTATDFDNAFAIPCGDFDLNGRTDVALFVFSTASGVNNIWSNGVGGFTDTAVSPLSNTLLSPRSAHAIDYDNDGDLDLYVSHTAGSSVLYRNDGGTFTDVTGGNPVDNFGRSGRGVAWGDIDNDGDLDAAIANGAEDNVILRNDSTPSTTSFVNITGTAFNTGIAEGISPVLFDYDNDGNLDIFVHTLEGGTGGPGAIYQGDGAFGFTDVTATVAPAMTTDLADGRGAAVADVDDDGDLDLYRANGSTTIGSGNAYFYINGTDDTNWLKVRVVGTDSDPQAFGTRISVFQAGTSTLVGYSQVQSQTAYESFNSLVQHFGVSSAETYDVQAVFPVSGALVSQEGVATAQTITLIEPTAVSGADSWLKYR